MDYRSSLQHLLRNLVPTRGAVTTAASAGDFEDTCPDAAHAAPAQASRTSGQQPRRPGAWAESAIDLVLGTEIMEYPDETAADLMDEFFAKSGQRAA